MAWNSLSRLGETRTYRDPLASASQMLKLKACVTISGSNIIFECIFLGILNFADICLNVTVFAPDLILLI